NSFPTRRSSDLDAHSKDRTSDFVEQKPFHLRPGHPQEQPQGSDQKVHVRTPELNRVFTVAGATLARRPASGAAFGGIVEARCNQNSTIGPFHLRWCGDTILFSPWQQSRKQFN